MRTAALVMAPAVRYSACSGSLLWTAGAGRQGLELGADPGRSPVRSLVPSLRPRHSVLRQEVAAAGHRDREVIPRGRHGIDRFTHCHDGQRAGSRGRRQLQPRVALRRVWVGEAVHQMHRYSRPQSCMNPAETDRPPRRPPPHIEFAEISSPPAKKSLQIGEFSTSGAPVARRSSDHRRNGHGHSHRSHGVKRGSPAKRTTRTSSILSRSTTAG
jgi:hypothetical protein